ncbi:MAG: DUF3859 domain-containing protein [Alphaproteobacteria bacterium]|nr:DUF3859 domain-containing protein [Alphaproteobacteria bacterium]
MDVGRPVATIGRRAGLGGALAGLLVAPVAAQTVRVDRAELIESGQFRATKTGQGVAPNSPTGRNIRVADVEFFDPAPRVPARLGVNFGIRFRLVGEPAGATVTLTETWRLPPPGLRDPARDNQHFTESTYDFTARIGEARFRGYGFDSLWEVLPGEWTIEIRHAGALLLSHSFTLFRP